WRAPLIPWMIVATGLLEGFGLLLAVGFFVPGTLAAGGALPAIGLVLVAINAGLWIAYRVTARARGIGPLTRAAIAEASLPLHIVGHALPALLFLIAMAAPDLSLGLMGAAGIAAVAGGAFWKYSIVVRAGYQQGFALAKF